MTDRYADTLNSFLTGSDLPESDQTSYPRSPVTRGRELPTDQAANVNKAASQLNLPRSAVQENPEEAEERIQREGIDNIVANSPRLRAYVAAKDKAFSNNKSEWEKLGEFEQLWTGISRGWYGKSAGRNAGNAGITMREVNRLKSQIAGLQAFKSTGQIPEENREALRQFNVFSKPDQVDDMIRLNTQNLNNLEKRYRTQVDTSVSSLQKYRTLPTSPEVGRVGEAGSFSEAAKIFFQNPFEITIDALASSAYPMAETITGSVIGGVTFGPPGFVLGTFGGSFSANYDTKFLEGLLKSNGNVQSKRDLEALIGNDKIFSEATRSAARYSAAVASFDALGGFIATKTLGSTVGRNVAAQTGVQAATGAGGEAAGQLASEGKITSPGEIFLEGILEIPGGAVDITLGQTFAKVRQSREQTRKAVDASIKGVQLDRMVSIVKDLETRKADKDTTNELIKAITGDDLDAKDSNVAVSSDDLNTFFQENPEAEADLKQNAPDLYGSYTDAFKTRSDVVIDVADYLTYLADYHDVIRNVAKVGDSDITLKEADDRIAEFDNEFKKTLDDVQSDITSARENTEAVSRVHSDILRQLRLIGFSREEAQSNADLMTSVFNNLAERSGRDPFDLYNDVGLQVVNQIAGINQTNRAQDILDSLRRFSPTPDRFKKGRTLSQVLEDSGKFTEDELFELKNPDASRTQADRDRVARGQFKPRERKQFLLKRAARLAADAGFIDNVESLKALETLLDSEAKADPVRQPQEVDQVAEQRDQAFAALQQVFTDRGVDILDTESALKLIQDVIDGKIGETPVDSTGQTFEQRKKSVKRGSITFPSTGILSAPTVISLTENRNLSTLLHESGHLYLELLTELAARSDSNSDLRTDLDSIKSWWLDNIEDTTKNGKVVTPGILNQLRERNPAKATSITADDITRFISKFGSFKPTENDQVILTELHEYFARGYEAYIFEGKAPSAELKGVFYRFGQWLKRIYQRFTAFQVQLDDNIRDVFNRLIASEDAIDQVKAETEFDSIFAPDSNIDAADFEEIRKAQAEVSQDAQNSLEQKVLNAYQRQQKKEFNAAKKRIRLQVEQEANESPVYQATNFLLTGEFLSENFSPSLPRMKLDRNILVDRYGQAFLNSLPSQGPKKIFASKKGKGGQLVSPDLVANIFGFNSGDAMVQAMVNTEPRKDFIENESQRRAEIELKDPMVDGSMLAEADIALNKSKEAFIKLELKTLNKKAGLDETPTDIAKRVARETIANMKTFEVQRLATFRNAELRATRAARDAVLAEDWVEAARQERIRLVQHYMYTEALKQSKAIDNGLTFLKKFQRVNVRKNITPDAVEQIDILLTRFDLTNTPLKDIQQRKLLRQFVEENAAVVDDTEFNDRILSATDITSWKELTVGQFLDMRDTVKMVAEIGRNSKKLIAQAKQLRFEDARDQMLTSLDDNITPRGKDPRDPKLKTIFQKWKGAGRWADSRLLGIEAIIEWLDGGRVDGPWRTFLWQPIADAEVRRNDLDLNNTIEIINIIEKFRGIKGNSEVVNLPNINESLSREGVIAAALNTGNDGNLQRLASTFGVDQDVILDSLDQVMSKEDWALVQQIWDKIAELWPEIVKTEEATVGLTPKAITPRKVKTRHGEFNGGYYPIAYDRTRSIEGRIQTDPDRQFKGGYGRANVKGGFTKERQDKIDSPLDLSLSVLPRHMSQVTHLISHKAAILDANKILSDRELHTALSEKLGPEYFDMFVEWVDSVAKDAFINDSMSSFFGKLRSNVATAIMGFSATTTISQVFGLASSAEIFAKRDADGVKMGNQYLSSGIASFMMHPLKQTEVVFGLSGEMRHRANNLDRDLRDQYNRIVGQSGIVNSIKSTSMQTIAVADMAVSIPTWLGAYHWAVDQGFNQQRAVAWADSRVRLSQSTGSVKDLSAAQRSTLLKAFTMFYGYFKAMWGRQRDIGRDLRNGNSFQEIAWRSFLLVVIPGVLSEIVLGRGPDCEGEEGPGCVLGWAAGKTLMYSVASLPMVRDAARAAENPSNFSPTPVLEGFKFAGQSIAALGKEEGAMSAFMTSTAKAAGYFMGLPVTQTNRTLKHIFEYIDGETDDITARELLLGPKR